MAIWQYRFSVIPKDSISDSHFKPKFDKDGLFADEFYWLKIPTNILFFEGLEKIIPKGKSWSTDLLILGSEESNCFEIYSESGYVRSVSFRINFISNYQILLSQIIEFCILNGLIILDESLSIVPLNFETVKRVIENASQVRKYNKLLSNKKDDSVS